MSRHLFLKSVGWTWVEGWCQWENTKHNTEANLGITKLSWVTTYVQLCEKIKLHVNILTEKTWKNKFKNFTLRCEDFFTRDKIKYRKPSKLSRCWLWLLLVFKHIDWYGGNPDTYRCYAMIRQSLSETVNHLILEI